jgi:TetR/AcrR family transcriptional regulator, regulator of mycofactocin system
MTRSGSGSTSGLRERKKALTRDNIEDTALHLFLERGYDSVRIEDICADSLVSQRTFFRYFASKEDLVLGRLRAHLTQAERLLNARPAHEPLPDTLRAVINQVTQDYVTEPEREVTRLRLVTTTPALETGLLNVFAGFERLVRGFAAARMEIAPDTRHARLVAAAVVAAFRVGLEMWIDNVAGLDLPDLIANNMEILTHRLYGNYNGTP